MLKAVDRRREDHYGPLLDSMDQIKVPSHGESVFLEHHVFFCTPFRKRISDSVAKNLFVANAVLTKELRRDMAFRPNKNNFKTFRLNHLVDIKP